MESNGSKAFVAELARRLGRDRKETETLLDGLRQALRQHCGELDTVAVPGFGNLEPVKHLEQVVTDRVSGQRMLLPPEIELTFHPGTKLRGQIEKLNRGV